MKKSIKVKTSKKLKEKTKSEKIISLDENEENEKNCSDITTNETNIPFAFEYVLDPLNSEMVNVEKKVNNIYTVEKAEENLKINERYIKDKEKKLKAIYEQEKIYGHNKRVSNHYRREATGIYGYIFKKEITPNVYRLYCMDKKCQGKIDFNIRTKKIDIYKIHTISPAAHKFYKQVNVSEYLDYFKLHPEIKDIQEIKIPYNQ